jgi:arginase
MFKLQLIAAGIGIGQDLAGVDCGPTAWLDFFCEHYPSLLAVEPDVALKNVNLAAVHLRTNKDSKIFPFSAYDQLANQVNTSQKKEILPVTLGGDHSIAIGSVMGSLLSNPDMKLLWIDAHGDINTPETTLTGRVHGMPLAYLLGLWAQDRLRPRLKEKNVVLFGVRDLDTGEKKIIRDLGIKLITQSSINRHGMAACWHEAAQYLDLKNSPVHVSFDVDAIDPQLFPQTGVPVQGGLSLYQLQALFQKLSSLKTLKALDIVEFNPILNADVKPTVDARHLLGQLLENLTRPSQNRRQIKKPRPTAIDEIMPWPDLAY